MELTINTDFERIGSPIAFKIGRSKMEESSVLRSRQPTDANTAITHHVPAKNGEYISGHGPTALHD